MIKVSKVSRLFPNSVAIQNNAFHSRITFMESPAFSINNGWLVINGTDRFLLQHIRRYSIKAGVMELTYGTQVFEIFPSQTADRGAELMGALDEYFRNKLNSHSKAGRRSKSLPSPEERDLIVRRWLAENGESNYEKLAVMLGGCIRSTAWRIARKYLDEHQPAPAVTEVE